ncbi:hypothetical protein D3C72_1490730 [compost metagenome]
MIQPAIGGGRLDHGVFAADLIGESRHAERVLDPAQHVQVRHAGLDHDHVGAFLQVASHFAQCFVDVARIHLVSHFVGLAQIGGRAHGIAERAVEGAGVLGRIRHDPRMDVAVGF